MGRDTEQSPARHQTRNLDRRGVVAFARNQLRAAVGDAVQGSLLALTQPRTAAKQLDATAVGDRLRDAVYRDRGLRAALAQSKADTTPPGRPATAEALHSTAAPEVVAEEPIRTRTMARLLAQQGAYARALRIYEAILEQDPDPALRHEADVLRAALARG